MKILLADDDRSLRRVIQFKLEKHGYDVTAVEDGELALAQLKKTKFALLLSDIKMPKVDGLELLEKAKKFQPDLKIILITAHATVTQAVQAVKLGAFDYITKPFEDEELLVALEKALAFTELESENKRLKVRLANQSKAPKMIGVSKSFKEMMALVNKIAATDTTVLITGESGTGKELVAKTLHYKSMRSEGKFVAVNCAAIPKDLLESELFGHKKGAFTGAIKDKKGKYELADGGTLFLDEISELAIDLQAKMLRALQERVIEPVGSETIVEVNVRVVSATNVNLLEQVNNGRFREDLYYRLNVIPIRVPSLSERQDDIPILLREFVEKYAPNAEIKLSENLVDSLSRHTWRGNIRELENQVERMIVLRKTDTLSINDLPIDFGVLNSTSDRKEENREDKHQTFHQAEKKIIQEALLKCGWNRTKAAQYLKIPRHVLIYRIKKYDITEQTTYSD